MKFLLLMLSCLLLSGCTREAPPAETIPAATAVEETMPASMYAPEHPLELQYDGGLKVYPLTIPETIGAAALGEDILLFSGQDHTTLTLLTGEALTVSATKALDFVLSPEDPSLRIWEDAIAFYDAPRQRYLVLDSDLNLLSRIQLTEPTVCSPILSEDRCTLYYCTAQALKAWELSSGIHRTVAEMSYDRQTVTALLLEDSVIQCQVTDGQTVHSLFFSAENGRQLSRQENMSRILTENSRYYATLPMDSLELLLFGEAEGTVQALFPHQTPDDCFFLPRLHAAVTHTLQNDSSALLHYYELSQGTLTAQLTLPPAQIPRSIFSGSNGTVWIYVFDSLNAQEILYRWTPTPSGFRPETRGQYSLPYSGNPTAEAMDQCLAFAARLEETYGIPILLGEDALSCQPWDYTFESEAFAPGLMQALRTLESCLSHFPKSILEQTAAHFSSLKIGLVRKISGNAASGAPDTATGVQYLDGTDAYVVISTGIYTRQALYHELFHLMETHILVGSTALDRWNELNPADFTYTFGKGDPAVKESYFSPGTRSFVDTYSMTYPREDRARVWENALLPGNRDLFRSEPMQAKLTALCKGVREAYKLTKSEEPFLWEQYLSVPLAYIP